MINCKSLIDFLEVFKNEHTCLDYFAKKKFRNGSYCPHCKNEKVYQFSNKKLFKCSKCRRQFTIKVGTIFEGSKISMKKWFIAIYLLTTSSKGISSAQMIDQVGVTRKTAWFMVHKIRECSNDNAAAFGDLEINEHYIGGKQKNKHYNKRSVKAQHVKNIKINTLKHYINKNIDMQASMISDAFKAYHLAKEYVMNKIIHTGNIENFWSIFKRGYIEVYRHISKKHLQRYINEYRFMYNFMKESFATMFDNVVKKYNKRLKHKVFVNG